MKMIDLTHSIKEQMPVYPGTEPPVLEEACTLEADGFRETLLSLYSHTGTHLDCPAHIFKEGLTTESMQIDRFMGKAAILDVSDAKGREVGLQRVEACMKNHADLEFLLLRTGWEDKWGQDDYYTGFPVFDQPAVEFLVGHGLKGIGLDTISLDPVDDYNLTSHRKILKNDCIIVENLCNLEELIDKEFTFCAFPLKFEKGDGSPVRAVAIL